MGSQRLALLVASMSLVVGCSEAPTAPPSRALSPALRAGGAGYTPAEWQASVNLSRGTLALYPLAEGQNLAQTFTPTENQWLGYLELPVGSTSGNLLNVKIRNGLDGDILYESNVAGLPEVVDGTFQLIQVYDPAVSRHGIKLYKDHEYAFELAAIAGPNSPPVATCGIARGPAANSYIRGRGYYRDLTGGPAPWLPLPNGTPTDDEDLPFITLSR